MFTTHAARNYTRIRAHIKNNAGRGDEKRFTRDRNAMRVPSLPGTLGNDKRSNPGLSSHTSTLDVKIFGCFLFS